MIRAPLSDAQRDGVLRRLRAHQPPGEIALGTGLHRRDVDALAAGAGIPTGRADPEEGVSHASRP